MSLSSSDLEKIIFPSLAHQWILWSEWVPSEWESKQLIKTSQVIHITPVHQLMSCEDKSCMFGKNKSIKIFFLTKIWVCNPKQCFLWWKKWSDLNQKRNLHRSSIVYKPKQSKTSLNKYVAGFWCERQQEMDFHCRKCYYGLWTCILAGTNSLKFKTS